MNGTNYEVPHCGAFSTPHSHPSWAQIFASLIIIIIIIFKTISTIIVRVTKSRRLRWASHIARMEKGRSAFKILTGKPTEKKPLGKPRRRWEDNFKMDLKEIVVNMWNCINSVHGMNYWRALVNVALNLQVP